MNPFSLFYLLLNSNIIAFMLHWFWSNISAELNFLFFDDETSYWKWHQVVMCISACMLSLKDHQRCHNIYKLTFRIKMFGIEINIELIKFSSIRSDPIRFGLGLSIRYLSLSIQPKPTIAIYLLLSLCVCFWFVLFAFHSLYSQFDWNVRNRIRMGENNQISSKWNHFSFAHPYISIGSWFVNNSLFVWA